MESVVTSSSKQRNMLIQVTIAFTILNLLTGFFNLQFQTASDQLLKHKLMILQNME